MADKQFKVQTPDGKTITVTAPENATDDQIESLAKDQYYKGSDRPKVDLSPKPDQIRIYNQEYRDAVNRIIEARKEGDQRKLHEAEQDRISVANELKRLGAEVPGAEPSVPPPAAQAPQPPQAAPGQSMVSAAREMMPSMDFGRMIPDVVGALAGERIAGGTQKSLENLLERKMAQQAQGITGPSSILGGQPRVPAQTSQSAAPVQAQAPDLQREARILRGTPGEMDISGRARQTGYNVQTAQEAAAQREMQAMIEQMRQRGVVGGTAQELLSRAPGMTASEHGVLVPRSNAPQTAGPRPPEPFVGPPVPPTAAGYTQAPPQQPGALQRAGQAVKSSMGTAGNIAMDALSSPRLAGAMGGFGAAEALQQYYGRREDDPLGAYLALASGALGGLSTLPVLPMPYRMGAAAASPLTMYLYDKFRPYRSVLERRQQAPQQ